MEDRKSEEAEANGYIEALRKIYAEHIPSKDWFGILQQALRTVPIGQPFILESRRLPVSQDLILTLSSRGHEAIEKAVKAYEAKRKIKEPGK